MKLQPPSEEDILAQYENELVRQAQSSYGQNSLPYSTAMMGGGQKQNLVEWQLDFSEELGKIEILLRNSILVRTKDGEDWQPNPDQTKVTMNETGVQDVVQVIYIMVNKNKVLSNYNEDEIKERVRLIKHELRVLIYNNYEKYAMDNEYKMNKFSMIIHTVGSLIEDAYRRAMNGEERKDLNSARMVNQNEPLMPQNFNIYPPQQKKGVVSRMMPWNWGKGGY